MIIADELSPAYVTALLLSRIADHHDIRLEFDRDYGMSKRTGWSVSVDGSVLVEFASDPLLALSLAVAQMLQDESEE
jgi:hypothetical protein